MRQTSQKIQMIHLNTKTTKLIQNTIINLMMNDLFQINEFKEYM